MFPFSSGLIPFPGDESSVLDNFCPRGEWPLSSLIVGLLILDSGKCYLNFIWSTADEQSNSLQTSSQLTVDELCFTEGNVFPPSHLTNTQVCISKCKVLHCLMPSGWFDTGEKELLKVRVLTTSSLRALRAAASSLWNSGGSQSEIQLLPFEVFPFWFQTGGDFHSVGCL